MSAIAGIFQVDGQPVDPAALQAMAGSLAAHGPDGSGMEIDGPCGLAHQRFCLSTQSLQEKQPLWDAGRQVCLAADAFLFDRPRLGTELGLDTHQVVELGDSELILAAYLRWGEACLEHLEGVYAFAAWDRRRGALFCATDPNDQRQLYVCDQGGRFLFASEPKGILAAPGVPRRLDEVKLAAIINIFSLDEDLRRRSYFAGIQRLPPAASLTVTTGGARLGQFWTPEVRPKFPYQRDEEWVEAVRERIFQVVAEWTQRCAYPVAALLSGGLDSSSVTAVAARLTAQDNRRLVSLSAVLPPDTPPGLSDERCFIDTFCGTPGLGMVYVTAPDAGPFDRLEELVRGGDQPLFTSRHYLYTAFATEARQRGARLILEGIGGELGPSNPGNGYIAERARRGDWAYAWSETRRQMQRRGGSPWRNFTAQAVLPLLPGWLQRAAPRRGQVSLDLLARTPLHRDFVQHALGERLPRLLQEAKQSMREAPDQRANQLNLQRLAWGLQGSSGFNDYTQVCLAYPFFDRRLWALCRSAPGHLKVHNGYRRSLVRLSMDGVLPPKIQWRLDKQPFASDYHLRYNRQRPAALELLRSIRPGEPAWEILDLPRLLHLVERNAQDNLDQQALGLVPTAVYIAQFLKQF